MLGTVIVLIITLGLLLLFFVALLFTVSKLAQRFGQKLSKLSLSPTHGITAEFRDSERPN